jgi:5-methyltetrahydropteroyltriglutamate--homocysteine methyltransferase
MGVLDVHDASVESVATIKDRILKGLEVVPPERLTVSPDCGMKLLPRRVAREKMANMVTAAREVETELDAGEVEVRAPASAD